MDLSTISLREDISNSSVATSTNYQILSTLNSSLNNTLQLSETHRNLLENNNRALGGSTPSDHTATFLIGFGILLVFVVFGVLASAFLCLTLKKDPYLWNADVERAGQEERHQEQEEGTTTVTREKTSCSTSSTERERDSDVN